MTNCKDCNSSPNLNPCQDCQYILNTDCVIYNGDRLDIEDDSVVDGSARTLTDILNLLEGDSCCTRLSKEVTGNYTVVEEDTQKLILLNGNTDTESDNVNNTYTIILPNSSEFAGKTLIFKDISTVTSGDPGGRVIWNFNTSVQYRWDTTTSTTSFETLINRSYSRHRTLVLTYVKIGISYQWIVVSDTIPDVVKTEITDVEMSNGWVTTGGSGAVKVCKLGKEIKIEGVLTGGTHGTTAFTLPVGSRPGQFALYLQQMDDNPYFAFVNITTGGAVQISMPGGTSPTPNNISLWGINFFTD